jgi:carboxyl-terminal processing protease
MNRRSVVSKSQPILAVILVFLGACAGPSADIKPGNSRNIDNLKSDATPVNYKEEFDDILRRIEREHYREIKLSKDLSARWIRRFIADSDLGKNLFTMSEVDELVKTYSKKMPAISSASLVIMQELFAHIANRAQQVPVLVDSIMVDPFDLGDHNYYRPSSNWPLTEADRLLAWKLMLQSEIVEWQLSGESRENAVEALSTVYRRSFAGLAKKDESARFELIVNSLLVVMDPHMRYTLKREDINFKDSDFMSGVGLLLQQKHGMIRVVEIIKDGPADRAGAIQAGDYIVAIAQEGGEYEAVSGYLLDEAIKRLRGPKGTVVRLRLRHPWGLTEAALTRETIKLDEEVTSYEMFETVLEAGAVNHSLYTDNKRKLKLAAIHFPAFYMDYAAMATGGRNYRSSAGDLRLILEKLDKQQVDGIVLDLRDNGGGSLDEGRNVAGFFAGRNPVLQIKYRSGMEELVNRSEAILKKPVVILVNEKSAGSSEIVAATIQDYRKGLVVGRRTFGLGGIQDIDSTPHGRLKITRAEYFRPTGRPFQRSGITPDIVLPLPRADGGDTSREEDLPGAMEFQTIAPQASYRQPSVGPDIKAMAEKYSSSSPEKRLNKYIGIARGMNEYREKGRALHYQAAKTEAEEMAALEKSLAAYGDLEQQEALKILADLIIQHR